MDNDDLERSGCLIVIAVIAMLVVAFAVFGCKPQDTEADTETEEDDWNVIPAGTGGIVF